MPQRDGTGPFGQGCDFGRSQGQGQKKGGGRMGGPSSAGPDGFCVCLSCGYRQLNVRGQPCNHISCPACGQVLTRE